MRTTPSGEAHDGVPAPEPAAVTAFWAMMTVVFLAAMDSTVVATVLPAIVTELGGASLLAWVVTGYLLTTAVSVPLWGKAADLTSRRGLYITATIVFLAASVWVALAPSMPALLAGRAVQGIGTGGLMALTPTLVGDLFPARIRGRFHGRMGAVLAGSSFVGPLVGGLFADTLGWRAAFAINLPLAALALGVVVRRLRPLARPAGRRRLDLVGASLLAAASTAFLLALSGGTPLAAEPYRTPLLAAAGVAAVAYLPWQARHRDPVLPLRMFRSPIVAAGIALSFVTGAAMLAAVVYAPLYAQTVQGRSGATAGALLLPLTGGVLLANITGGSLITRLGRYRPFPIAGTLAVTVGFGLLATISTSTSTVRFAAGLTLVGTGLGLTMQPAVLAVQNAVDGAELGAATAASTFFRQLGATLAVGGLGGLLATRAGPQLAALTDDVATGAAAAAARADVAAALGDLFLTMIPVAVAAVIAALLLQEKPLSTTTPAASRTTRSDEKDGHDDPLTRPNAMPVGHERSTRT
ncbi:MAG: MFS transporter [Actinomycetota bacterium]|nr:MFS transporter [Actinomycetota bacterium]